MSIPNGRLLQNAAEPLQQFEQLRIHLDASCDPVESPLLLAEQLAQLAGRERVVLREAEEACGDVARLPFPLINELARRPQSCRSARRRGRSRRLETPPSLRGTPEPAPGEFLRDLSGRCCGGHLLAVRFRLSASRSNGTAINEPLGRITHRPVALSGAEDFPVVGNHEKPRGGWVCSDEALNLRIGAWRRKAYGEACRNVEGLPFRMGSVKDNEDARNRNRPPGPSQECDETAAGFAQRQVLPGRMALDDIVAVDQNGVAVSRAHVVYCRAPNAEVTPCR